MMIDETHDPALACPFDNDDFPIQSLPYGVFSTATEPEPRAGVAIGDFIFDLRAFLDAPTLNPVMALPKAQRVDLRRAISHRLRDGRPESLVPMSEATLHLPAAVGDFTDFYASRWHAERVGRRFRPDQPLLPNYDHIPIAYHGRSSTIILSGTPVRRPLGQLKAGIEFGPSQKLDYETELGIFAGGPPNALGEPVPIEEAADRLFGVCLLNDWSARDIQSQEYQPLGPFLGKNFATTISPWVVTMEALEPFRRPARRAAPVLPYLAGRANGAYAIWLEARVNGHRKSRSTTMDLDWTFEQMLAHHASNGCIVRPGDLIGTGTVSGPGDDARGCLLELGEPFLADGDEVTLTGEACGKGWRSLRLGVASGTILPAVELSLREIRP